MNYLYHRVPQNMKGETLYPLNRMKDIDPEIFSEHLKKYEGREFIMERQIPPLGCLWNDVLHLSAVHPQEIQKLLVEKGSELKSRKFFEIDPYLLDKDKMTIYLYPWGKRAFSAEDFTPFDPDNVGKYAVIPEETERYYKETLEKDERPLLWHGIPHFLYYGPIDIKGMNIIEI